MSIEKITRNTIKQLTPKRMRKVNIEYSKMKTYFEQGYSIREVSKLFNTTETTVRKYMKIFGLSSNRLIGDPKIIPQETLKELIKQQKSKTQMAADLNVSITTIYSYLAKYNLLPPKKRKPSGKPLSNKMLKQLVDKGLSIRQISEKFCHSPSHVYYKLKEFGLKTKYAIEERRNTIPKEKIEKLVSKKLSRKEMAKNLGLHTSTVRAYLKKHGLYIPKHKAQTPHNPNITKETLSQMVKDGKSLPEIAKEFGEPIGKIRYHLQQFNIQTNEAVILNTTTKETLLELIQENLNIQQVAKRLNITSMSVGRLLKKYKLKTTPESIAQAMTEEEWKQLYHNDKLSIKKIAKKLNLGVGYIIKLLEKHHIERRIKNQH